MTAGQIGAAPDGITGLEDRHPGTRHFGPLFAFGHLRDGEPKAVSSAMATLAAFMIGKLPDGPELTAGLRKLLEAKDCMVRASLQ